MATKSANLPSFGQVSHLFRLAEQGLMTSEMLQGFLEQPDKFIRPVFPVVVPYDQLALPDMISLGKYDYVNGDITAERFPIVGSGETPVELLLVHFGEDVSTDQARQRLDEQELEPAKIEHLLMFGVKYPELQSKWPIVALGSVWVDSGGDRSVACLGGDSGERRLYLVWVSVGWRGGVRFLAFRK